MRYYAGVAELIQATTDFEATPGIGCTFCEWRDRCEEAARVEAGEHDWLEDEEPDAELHHGESEASGGP